MAAAMVGHLGKVLVVLMVEQLVVLMVVPLADTAVDPWVVWMADRMVECLA